MRVRRDGRFWYDTDAAERVVDFFPTFLRHIEGPWAGRPLELADWQKDRIIRPLYGWKRPHTCASPSLHDPITCEYGRRRYRELDLWIPRKNGKTTICAGLVLVGICADDEIGAQVYSAAWDQDQAGVLYNIAATMVEKSPTLVNRLRVVRSTFRIADPVTNSFYAAIPSGSAGAVGPNVHMGMMDEYWNQADTDLEKAIQTGMGARTQPIFVRASTSGKRLDTPAGRRYQRIKDVIRGVREPREDELIVLYEAPEGADWRVRRVWIGANPGYGTSLQPTYVDKQIATAIDDPHDRPEILRFGLNIWPDALDSWMPLEKWDTCGGIVDLDAMAGRSCVVAVSMPSAVDIAAIAIVFLPVIDVAGNITEPYRVVMEFYLPSDLLVSRAKQPNAPPYQEWVDKGALHLTDGDVLDYARLESVVADRYEPRFSVREVVCNPRGAMQFIQDLQARESVVVELVPGFKTMSPALTELRRLVGLGRAGLVHDGSIVLRWMWTKAKVRVGPNEEIRPDRERSLGNIEGVIAVASALNRAIVVPDDQEESWAAS